MMTNTNKMLNNFITEHKDNFRKKELFDRAETEVVDRNLMSGQGVGSDGLASGRSTRRRRFSDAMIEGGYSDPKDRETYLVYPIEHEATVSVGVCFLMGCGVFLYQTCISIY